MKLLDESNKINDDLDHVSFDKSCLPQNEEFDTNEGIQYIDMLYNTAKYQTKNIHQLEIGKIDSFDDYYSNNTATPIKSELNRLNHSLGRQSPSPQLNPICQVFTPQTPSSINDYSFQEAQNRSCWPTDTKNTSFNCKKTFVPITPPPSAKFTKTNPLSITTNGCNTSLNECLSPNMCKLLSPPQNGQLNFQPSQLNNILKHTFYGSPNRVVNNSFHKNMGAFSPLVGLKQQHQRVFNSNSDLPRCSSPSRANDSFFNKNDFDRKYNQQHTWSGRLPPKIYLDNGIYSRKVFLGGLPWDVNQNHLTQILQKFGPVKLEIPGKDSKHPRVSVISKTPERATPGYVYIIFEHESAVQRLLAECRKEMKNGGEHYFFTILVPPPAVNFNNSYHSTNNPKRAGKAKEVEVIPWNQEDTSFVPLQCSLPNK